MAYILFYIKELYYKIILLILLLLSIIIIIVYKSKMLFLFILSPLKKIKIYNLISEYKINEISHTIYEETLKTNTFIPIIEINLPFFTTSYIYLKYIILFAIYLMIPIFLYFLYISISPILKKKEHFKFKFICIYLITYVFINFIIIHNIIIPLFITFIYSHYNEFLYYEFDVEFQLITYLNLYFKLLFFNIFFFILINIKKYLNLNIHIVILLLIVSIFLPTDFIVQVIYLLFIIMQYAINEIIYKYQEQIRKYKQMEFQEKN